VTHISPDTINFQFSSLIEKKIPVHLNSKLKFEPQFRLEGDVVLSPDSVWVIGAQAIIDSVKQVETKLLELKKLNETKTKKIGLIKVEGLSFIQKKVEVKLTIEQFTEAEKHVRLKVINVPGSVFLRLFPHEIKLSYLVGLKDYETISEEQFELEADFTKMDTVRNKLKVYLKNSPLNVSNVSFYPKEVGYLIEKRNSGEL
jgi:YbbR domain-containing protein